MKSLELKKRAREEENDIKAFALYAKAQKEKRLETFKNHKNILIKNGFIVEYNEEKHQFTIQNTHLGIIDFFPKSNKALIRKSNKWVSNGYYFVMFKLKVNANT